MDQATVSETIVAAESDNRDGMPKRPSKRWNVPPGYELPVTRLKARQDAIVMPRTQDIPLPLTRKRRIRLSAPAAKRTSGNAEEVAPQDQAEKVQTGNHTDEMTAEKQIENMIAGNQSERTLENQMEQKVSSNHPEERVPGNLIDVNASLDQMEEEENPFDQVEPTTPESQTGKVTQQHEIMQTATSDEIGSTAKLDNTGTLDNADIVGIVGNVGSQDTVDNLGAVMRNMTITSTEPCTPVTVDQTTTTDTPVMFDKATMIDTPIMVDKETLMDKPGMAADKEGTEGQATALDQGAAHPAAGIPAQHPQQAVSPKKKTSSSMNKQSSPLRLGGPGDKNPGRVPHSGPGLPPTPTCRSGTFTKPLFVTERPLPKDDILEERRFIYNPNFEGLSEDKKKRCFSVASYNVRAELEKEENGTEGESGTGGYAGCAGGGVGTGKGHGRRGCRGAEKTDTPSSLLPNNYFERLIKDLSFIQSDVVCLQSVDDCFWQKLQSTLHNWGYGCLRIKRRTGPIECSEAIFFKSARFDLVKSHAAFLDDLIVMQAIQPGVIYHPAIRASVASREVVVIVTLHCKITNRRFRVANTRCVPEHKHRPDLQAAQVCSILRLMALWDLPSNDRLPMILCGDLDFQPDEGPYQVLRDGFISDSTYSTFSSIDSVNISCGKKTPLAAVYRGGFRHSFPTIKSAYAKVLGSEPSTVWKRESDSFVCGSYVWFDEAKLSVVGVLKMVPSKVVTGPGIPDLYFPSGNLSLRALFQFSEDALKVDESRKS